MLITMIKVNAWGAEKRGKVGRGLWGVDVEGPGERGWGLWSEWRETGMGMLGDHVSHVGRVGWGGVFRVG